MKEILKEWLLANCDCEYDEKYPDSMGMNRGNLDLAKLAQFILDNPCTD